MRVNIDISKYNAMDSVIVSELVVCTIGRSGKHLKEDINNNIRFKHGRAQIQGEKTRLTGRVTQSSRLRHCYESIGSKLSGKLP